MNEKERDWPAQQEIDELRGPLEAAISAAVEGLELDASQIATLALHSAAVLAVNRRVNLTRIVEPAEVARLQVLDSLLIGRALEIGGDQVMDLGSGAGYPGIPLAIAHPNAEILLVESRRKKADFLSWVQPKLALGNVEVARARGEHYLSNRPAGDDGTRRRVARLDWIVARAVGGIADLQDLLRPVHRTFARLAMAKGPNFDRELAQSAKRLDSRAYELERVARYRIGEGYEERCVAVFQTRDVPVHRWRKKGRMKGGVEARPGGRRKGGREPT